MHERAITTLIYVVGAVGLQTVLGFSIAYLISRRVRGRGLMTTLFLSPMMLSPVVVGLFWKFMLDTQFGVINSLLGSLGLGPGRVADEPAPRAALADHRRHLAVDAVHHAHRARGPDRGAAVPLRGSVDRPRLRVVPLPPHHAAAGLAAAADRHPLPRDRGVPPLRPRLHPHAGRSRRVDRDALVPRLQGGLPGLRHRPGVGLRDPHGDRGHHPRAVLPALPRPAPGGRDGAPGR